MREVTEAIYAFLVQEEMQKKIGIYEVQFQERGQLVLAKEYAQIYRIVLELFDKFTELLGEEQISLGEYRELLDAGLQEQRSVWFLRESIRWSLEISSVQGFRM